MFGVIIAGFDDAVAEEGELLALLGVNGEFFVLGFFDDAEGQAIRQVYFVVVEVRLAVADGAVGSGPVPNQARADLGGVSLALQPNCGCNSDCVCNFR